MVASCGAIIQKQQSSSHKLEINEYLMQSKPKSHPRHQSHSQSLVWVRVFSGRWADT